ncbi:putative DNA-binding protein HU-alpha [Pseudoalteromonas luteoviolacea B = ATCC 29581]|nr:putative DNA-binding protein HU-alpha [Pseudoalteromonas luteoviolacea B = ATCC 29581]
MNKKQLIDDMAELADLTKVDTTNALNSLLNLITKRLSEGDPITLHNLGTLSLSYHPAKVGRNPQTGEKMMIEGKNKIAFKAAKGLKETL